MAAEPQRALPLGGRHDFNFYSRWCEGRELLVDALADVCEHPDVVEGPMLPVGPFRVHVTLDDGLEGGVLDADGLFSEEAGLEKHWGRRKRSLRQ